MLLDEFKNPSNQYRPIPFWSWNDKLEKEEIRYQIEEMKKARVGGYFMHARSGLKTPYLSEEWFDCIQTGIEEAKKTGLHAWVYDEEGWPSGFAGGRVPEMSPDFHAKFISMERHASTDEIDMEAMLAVYKYRKDSKEYELLSGWGRLSGEDGGSAESGAGYVCGDGEELLAIRRHTNPYYIDTLNKRAVDAFLQVTHEEYYKRFGEDFGTYMHGFFTDEPRLTCDNIGDLAWSDDLPSEFKKAYGYEITDALVGLYLPVADYEKYRYDFWQLVSALFVQNYMKNIYDWCEAHNCKATGHIMMEESIFSQMTSTAGVMPFYEYLHTPGIDWLRRPISSPVIAKQVGSAACQLGKKQVITESFALSGWDVSFEELKWIAEWQFVNGVNQICQHLQGYDIRGVRKRDYPPSLFTQQTWWKEYGKFNDYLGRLCAALCAGNQVADVLLLHPMRSGYVTYDGSRTPEIRKVDDEFTKASETLSGSHISYHFGDETLIKKYGDVKDGRFIVGEIGYRTVVLPHMHAIDGKTLALLLAFAENGGTILSLGRFPTYTNGALEDLTKLKEKTVSLEYGQVRKHMEEKGLLALSVQEKDREVGSISYLQRDSEDGSLFFLVNHNQKESYETTVSVLNRNVQVVRLVAESGETEPVCCSSDEHGTTFKLHFEPMQSYLLLCRDAEAAEGASAPESDCSFAGLAESGTAFGRKTACDSAQERQEVMPGENWTIDEIQLNSMTLDLCKYRVDGGEWQGPISTIKVQQALLDLQRPCDVELEFLFQVETDLSKNKEFYAVIEDAALYQIEVNGKAFAYENLGWWKDKSFHKVDIKSAVQPGENRIVLKTTFKQPQKVYDVLYGEGVYETEINKITYDMEIENIYLLGDFGVVSKGAFRPVERKGMFTDGPFVIVDAPKTLEGNLFTTQGLLYFAGDMKISQTLHVKKEEGKRLILKMGRQRCPLIKVFVNGKLVKDSFWAPYEADITDFAVDGDNTLTYQVFASNRNLLGPHHHIDGECYNVGPESFTGKWSWVERKSEADATEIFDMNKNYWTDSYCFVEFGL